jgi:hypothetical protein
MMGIILNQKVPDNIRHMQMKCNIVSHREKDFYKIL